MLTAKKIEQLVAGITDASSSPPAQFAAHMRACFGEPPAVASAAAPAAGACASSRSPATESSELRAARNAWQSGGWGDVLDEAQTQPERVLANVECLLRYGFPIGDAFLLFCDQEPPSEEAHERKPFERVFTRLLMMTDDKSVLERAAMKVARRSFREKGLKAIGLNAQNRKLFTAEEWARVLEAAEKEPQSFLEVDNEHGEARSSDEEAADDEEKKFIKAAEEGESDGRSGSDSDDSAYDESEEESPSLSARIRSKHTKVKRVAKQPEAKQRARQSSSAAAPARPSSSSPSPQSRRSSARRRSSAGSSAATADGSEADRPREKKQKGASRHVASDDPPAGASAAAMPRATRSRDSGPTARHAADAAAAASLASNPVAAPANKPPTRKRKAKESAAEGHAE